MPSVIIDICKYPKEKWSPAWVLLVGDRKCMDSDMDISDRLFGGSLLVEQLRFFIIE
jgi:hypothetical protein